MKKLALVFTLAVVASYAQANQCPPAEALSHPNAAQHWKLDKKYMAEGWYVMAYPYSDTSRFSKLPTRSGDGLTVNFVSNEDESLSQWFVTCEYSIWDSAFPRKLVVTNNQFLPFDPVKTPVTHFYNANPDYTYPAQFTCGTTYGDLAHCSW